MLFYLYRLLWDSPLKNFLLRYWAPAECYFIPTGYCGILHSRTFCWDTEPLLNVILSLQVIVGFSTQELSAEILSPCWMLFYPYRLLWDSPLKNFLLRYWAPAECYFIPTGYCGILHSRTFCWDTEPLLNVILSLQVIVGFSMFKVVVVYFLFYIHLYLGRSLNYPKITSVLGTN